MNIEFIYHVDDWNLNSCWKTRQNHSYTLVQKLPTHYVFKNGNEIVETPIEDCEKIWRPT